jgi:superfamily II DNA or RNA helicase
VVASIQTIAKRQIPEPDLVIVDEAHHARARTWDTVLNRWDRARILGWTATPQRLDGHGLHQQFDALVEGPTAAWLIEHKFLSTYRLYCPPERPDLAGVHQRGGDYVKSELAERVNSRPVLAAAVRNYRLLAPGRRAIGFCVSVAHAEHVQRTFFEAGLPATIVHGGMGNSERSRGIDAFRQGSIKILLSVDLISEGFDVPACDCVLLLRPTASLALYLQQVGRALRPSDQPAMVLDCAGNSLVHGMPDDLHEWSLDDIQKAKKGGVAPVPVRVCPRCFSVHRPALVCPFCGHVHHVTQRVLEEEDVLLVDRTEELRAKRREVGQARDRAALLEIAKQRGYKPGWADRILAARTSKGIVR